MKKRTEMPTQLETINIAIIRIEQALSEAAHDLKATTGKRDAAVTAEIAATNDATRGAARVEAAQHSRHIAELEARREALEGALQRAQDEREAALGQDASDAREIVMATRRQQAERLLVHALEIDELARKLGAEHDAFSQLAVEINGDVALRPLIPDFGYAMSEVRARIQARLGHFSVLLTRSTDDPTKPAPSLAARIKLALETLLPGDRK